MLLFQNSMKEKAALWLRQGMSPSRLALTLALGFAIGCVPIVGIPTLLCAVLALALRLNLPAIQAANYAVMPLQIALMIPFARLGGWLFPFGQRQALTTANLFRLSAPNTSATLVSQIGSLAGQAMLAWLVVAIPAVLLMTLTLAVVLRRIPALAAAESGD